VNGCKKKKTLSTLSNPPKCMLLSKMQLYLRNLFSNSMLSISTCYVEMNFNFNISKNLCQFAKMSVEPIDSLFRWTDFTQAQTEERGRPSESI
jgi:hypothetical protein